MVVEGWLERAAATGRERTALQTPTGSWSYGRLLDAARSGAGELARRGVLPGQRVAVALAPGLEFAQAMHACLLLGAVCVPIDPRASASERALIAAGTDALVEQPLGEEPAPDSLPLSGGHHLDATAAVIHTSGTTARPRAIELSYGNFLWSALGSAVALGLDPRERWLCAMPVCHVGGLSILLRSCIYATTAVVHEQFDTDSVLAALRTEEITLVSLVATTLARLLDAGLSDAPSLRWALTGGGPVPAELCERARAAGVPITLTYGLTEAASQVTTGGPPLFCTRLAIAPDGEILVQGPTVAAGAVATDGWLHTGDLGRLDDNAHLHVSGRKSDTIVSGGENVAPAEVEAVLEAHPNVLEAAVLGRTDPRWGEAVTAIVVARPDAAIEADALREHCALRLAPHKVPKRIEELAGPLPRTRSGKLLRRELA